LAVGEPEQPQLRLARTARFEAQRRWRGFGALHAPRAFLDAAARPLRVGLAAPGGKPALRLFCIGRGGLRYGKGRAASFAAGHAHGD
jgi:hypothetical protein